ncbi:ABC transporter permease [Cupriavidus sp. USMAA2-4]|uniref:ABC transporter permease n=1 Tax=Cupriavidus sp. USMAA2-4 TaxID=876364 RepID=UPI0008A6C0A9|nr:ABC transporter permease [Cupriavidus sp. USMAA2-4]AOY94598.1 ABC transporter permease [Cupriavidus sp. USMAA2-4]
MQTLFYLGRRLGAGAVMVLAVIVLNFLLLSAAPGDVADVIAAQSGGGTAEQVAALRSQLGLDAGLGHRLTAYVGNVLHGQLGDSLFFHQPVLQLILERVPNTLMLVLPALLLAVVAGTLLGTVSAHRPRGALSAAVTFISLAGFAAPVFWSGMMLLIVFAYWLPLFPASGMYTMGERGQGWVLVLDVLHHLVLPVLSLSMIYLAQYSRQARATMLDVLGADYIRTARAKGMSEGVVVYRHALKNTLLPIVTLAGLQFSHAMAGAVLVETVFNWPGLGRLASDAVLNRDYPLMLGILLMSGLLVVAANILTDWLYSLLDPRIRTTG